MGGHSDLVDGGGESAALPVVVPEGPWRDGSGLGGAGDGPPILKVTAAIADAVSAADVFEALVDHVAEAVGASSAALWLLDGRVATMVRCRGYSDEAARALHTLWLDADLSMPVLDCLRSGAPIWVASQQKVHERYPHLRSLSTADRSYRVACLPLVANDRILGALGLTIEAAGDAADAEKEFLLLVARYATQAIERLRLFEAEAHSRAQADAAAQRLRVLNRASRSFSDAALDLPVRLRAVAAELSETLDSCINLGLLGQDGLLDLAAVHHPIPEADAELRRLIAVSPLRSGEGVIGRIAATGTSVLLPSIEREMVATTAPPDYRAFLAKYPPYALIGAAVRVHDRVIGTVTATRFRAGQTYTADDLRLLEELAERAAVAIENGRLYQETLEARGTAEQLYRFAQAVVAADRVEVVYEAALTSIEAALGVRRSAVLVFDKEGVMRFKAWRELSDTYRAAVEGHSPWPRDSVNPEPVVVEDALNDPSWAAYAEVFRAEQIGAVAFIPLVSRGHLLGKFMLYYDRPRVLTTAELDVARAIANHLGSVIARFAALNELEETIRYNELFAGALAHDLRTPLSAIMNAAQLLLLRQEGEGGARIDAVNPLGRIVRSGERMKTMIGQLLDFTESRSGGGIRIEARPTNLDDLCAQAVGEVELVHPQWQIQYTTTGDPVGRSDPERLLQAVSNLLSNAGQHGKGGEPIAITLDGSAADELVVSVHNGGAVPPALLPHIFDPFRTTRHRGGQSSGLGLGLFIVREIVRAHRGAIDVSSSEAEGTTVSLRLPR
jgi:signal transduction histidine kinase